MRGPQWTKLVAGTLTLAATALLAGCSAQAAPATPTTSTEAPAATADLVTQAGPHRHPTLQNGDRGDDVVALQQRLIHLGAPLKKADGIFGDATLHHVLTFQRAEGITADGVVGITTWASLEQPKATHIRWTDADVPSSYSTAAVTPQPQPRRADLSTAPAGDALTIDPASPTTPTPSGSWTRAVVTLSTQTAVFYNPDGSIALQAPISSGHDGLTPAGTFHVQSKSIRAFAGNGVYMNHMVRFNGGIGFHSIPKRANGADLPTPLGQKPVSHGCIRMNDAQAAQVYDHLALGAVVEIRP